MDAHSAMAMAQGFTRMEVQGILKDIDGSALIDDKTKQVLHLAARVTRESFKIHDGTLAPLRNLGATEAEIFEAIAVAALFNFMDRMADALGAPEEGFQDMIEQMQG